jgi:hypothetical protein
MIVDNQYDGRATLHTAPPCDADGSKVGLHAFEILTWEAREQLVFGWRSVGGRSAFARFAIAELQPGLQ